MISDCLVLKIVETESFSGEKDNTMYVLYDCRTDEYIIRGVRNPTYKTVFEPYSFRCLSTQVLVDLISLTVDNDNSVSYSLYNCNNLPYESDDISIDILNYDCCKGNEVVGYDNMKLSNKVLRRYVGIVGNMFNPY
jgi:hypothetical protein